MPDAPDAYDFFVSYARKDNETGWISHFIEALQEEHRTFSGGREFSVFLDQKEIRSLDDWRHRLYESLAASRLLVAFISPNYFASEWCRREWRAWLDLEIAKHILSDGAATVYIVEMPWLHKDWDEQQVAAALDKLSADSTLPGTAHELAGQMRQRQAVKMQTFYDEGLEALRRADVRRVLEKLARELGDRAQRVVDAESSPNTVPPYNKRFTGRLAELTQLRELLDDDRAGVITSIHGLGGVGKTELAFTYAHAYASLYLGGRYLIPCAGQLSLRFAALALDTEFRDRITDDERSDPNRHFAAILRCLRELAETRGRVLLLLDNVDRREALSPAETDSLCVAAGRIHLLATTRLGPEAKGPRVDWLTLGALPDADALALLEKHRAFASKREREAAERIVKRLGGFTLAVELIAAWLEQHEDVSCADFLVRLGLEELEALDALGEDSSVELRRHSDEKRLRAVLMQTLVTLSPHERRAMEYAALLAPDCIPSPWLAKLVSDDFPELKTARRPGYPDPWEAVMRRLFSLTLLMRCEGEEADPRIVRMHRLVGEVLNAENPGLKHQAETRMHLIFGRLMDPGRKSPTARTIDEHRSAEERRWEVPPVDSLAQCRWELQAIDELMHFVGSREIRLTSHLGRHLGSLWQKLCEWGRAERAYRLDLDLAEAEGGPRVGESANNLAVLLWRMGRLDEAEPLIKGALLIAEDSGESADLAQKLGNLGQILWDMNRPAEAEPLLRRAVGIYRKVVEWPDPPDTQPMLLGLLRRLAPQIQRQNYLTLGDWFQGYATLVTFLTNLAWMMIDMSRLDEAEKLLLQADNICAGMKASPSFHGRFPENGANTKAASGNIHFLNDRWDDAEKCYREALALEEASRHPLDPLLAAKLSILGSFLISRDRLEEAEPCISRALEIHETSLGPESEGVATSLMLKGLLQRKRGQYEEAETLQTRALAMSERMVGSAHPDLVPHLKELASLRQAADQPLLAETPLRRALEILLQFTKAAGHPHRQLPSIVKRYTALLQEMGRSTEAIQATLKEMGYRGNGSDIDSV